MAASPNSLQHVHQPSSSADSNLSLKRAYLAQLPPDQIIEICLTLEHFAPLHIQHSIWPADLRSSISTTHSKSRSSTPQIEPDVRPVNDNSSNDSRATASFTDPPQPPSDSAPVEPPPSGVSDSQPENETASPAPSTSPPVTQVAATTVHPHTPLPPQPSYHHQPYGYTHPPSYPQAAYLQAAYPHSPYYSSPYSSYASPSTYPTHPQSQPSTSYANPPLRQLPEPAQNLSDDLPSYEQMIVEALTDFGDPEGAPPKDLFSWMAARYPLQANFRPSASQALHKAFKKGRLLKSNNGLYSLNPSWEGTIGARRTTRRPQTHQSTSQPQHSQIGSPFTRAPLVHDHQNSTGSSQSHSGHHPNPSVPNVGVEEETGVGSDAWQAAQNILNAINFGGLLQLPQEEEDHLESTNPNSQSATAAVKDADTEMNVESSGRAELQAQLALLAAQLAEIGEENGRLAEGDEESDEEMESVDEDKIVE